MTRFGGGRSPEALIASFEVMRSLVTLIAFVLVAAPGWSGLERHDDGTVTDATAALRWTQKGNGVDINYPDSLVYCEALELGGFDDWRLPSLEEARTLFRPDAEPENTYEYRGEPQPLRIDNAFTMTAPAIWTSDASYRGVPTTYLYSSGRDFSWRGEHSNFQRVLCVRAD